MFVDSRRRPYHWALYRPGTRKPLASGRAVSAALRVPLPRGHAGLYELALRSGSHASTVPLVAHAAKIFARHGYDQTTIGELDRAGVFGPERPPADGSA